MDGDGYRYTKLHYPYLECPLKKHGFSNYIEKKSILSIIITCCNEKKEYLNRTIDSIRKTAGDKIDLFCLIKNGLIQPHTKIVKVFKGNHYEAVITTNGQIELTFNGVKKTYKSPSSAAADLAQAPKNGWTWWSLEGDPKGRTLDYYRQKYIQHGKETGR